MNNLENTIQGFNSLNRMKLMMNYDSTQTLNENENRLLEQINKQDFVFVDLLSPDKKYAVFFDELIDLENKKHLGSLWESVDNFRLFFEQTIYNSKEISKTIKEDFKRQWKEILLTESFDKKDLSILKEGCRILFSEAGNKDRTWGQWLAGSYVGKAATDLYTGTTQFAKDAYSGGKALVGAVMSGDVKKIFTLLGQGVIYFARYLRKFMYNPIGGVIDTVLITLGIGKAVQWIPWAIIVALDIYEVTTGDYEQKGLKWWEYALMIGADVLGLVFAGSAAIAARAALKSGAKEALKSPTIKDMAKKVIENIKRVPEFLNKAIGLLKPRAPKIADWLSGLVSKAGQFIQTISTNLGKIFSKEGAKTTAKVGARELSLGYGIEKGFEYAGQAFGAPDVSDPTRQVTRLSSNELERLSKIMT